MWQLCKLVRLSQVSIYITFFLCSVCAHHYLFLILSCLRCYDTKLLGSLSTYRISPWNLWDPFLLLYPASKNNNNNNDLWGLLLSQCYLASMSFLRINFLFSANSHNYELKSQRIPYLQDIFISNSTCPKAELFFCFQTGITSSGIYYLDLLYHYSPHPTLCRVSNLGMIPNSSWTFISTSKQSPNPGDKTFGGAHESVCSMSSSLLLP